MLVRVSDVVVRLFHSLRGWSQQKETRDLEKFSSEEKKVPTSAGSGQNDQRFVWLHFLRHLAFSQASQAAPKRKKSRKESWMPFGGSVRVPRRGVHPCHASCEPLAADPYPSQKKIDYGAPGFVALVAFLLYCSTVFADFAYDDSRAIKTNQDLLPSTPLYTLFQNDFWGTPLSHSGSHKSYRPLCVLSFRLNYYFGGFDPRGYHLTNVILHALVSAAFTRLAAFVFVGHAVPTLVAGLLFAAHPVHTEAVAGVVGRADVGSCLFFLICFALYVKYCECRDRQLEYHSRRWLYLYGAIGCATLSMLTKEHGVTVLAVCAVYDMLIHHKISVKQALRITFNKRFFALREGLFHIGATAVTLLCFRMHLMGSKPPDFAPADNPAADSDSLLTRSLTFLFLPAFNFWLLIYPRWLSFDWSMDAIPLLNTCLDVRNGYIIAFYGALCFIAWWLITSLNKRSDCDSALLFCSTKNGHLNSDGQLCSCLSITQKVASFFTSKNSNKNNRKHGYSASNGHASHMNGHRAKNGHHQRSNGHQESPYKAEQIENLQYLYTCKCKWSTFINASDVVTFAVALIVLPFIPATNLFFYVGFVIAERILYIPSMGFCLLIGLGVDHVYRRQNTNLGKKIVMSFFLTFLMIMSVRTVLRNRDWMTEENLYRSGIPVNPPKAYGNLANILSSQGKKEEAEQAYKKALSYRANMADVRYNLGILLQEQSRYEEALYSYRLAIQFRPRLAMAHLNMGLVLGLLGKRDEAAEVYRHCAELDVAGLKDPKMHESTRISALFNLGRLYADEGKYQEAMNVYNEAIAKMPAYYQPQSLYNMMGEAFFKMGQYVQAEHWYREALRAKPDHIPAHLTYAKMLTKWKRYPEAERWFLKAKAIAPNDSSVYQHYGQFLGETERYAESADVFAKAAEISPDDYEIVFGAADALRQAGRNDEAEILYYSAVKLKPDEVTSHMNLGAMLHVNGKFEEAEAAYLEALRLKPDDVITQTNLQKLRNLLVQKELAQARIAQQRELEKADTQNDSA